MLKCDYDDFDYSHVWCEGCSGRVNLDTLPAEKLRFEDSFCGECVRQFCKKIAEDAICNYINHKDD